MNLDRESFLKLTTAAVAGAIIPSVPLAVKSATVGANVAFDGVDWPAVFASCPRLVGFDRMCGAKLNRTYFAVRGRKGSSGFPSFRGAVSGIDRESGLNVAAIPMQCGGTAGATNTFVFVLGESGPVLVDEINRGYKMRPFFVDGRLHIASANLLAGDCNARPSARTVRTYAVYSDKIEERTSEFMFTAEFEAAYDPHVASQVKLVPSLAEAA